MRKNKEMSNTTAKKSRNDKKDKRNEQNSLKLAPKMRKASTKSDYEHVVYSRIISITRSR